MAEYLLLRSFGVNQLICKPSRINHPAKPGVDPATGKEVKASQQSIRVATDWSSLETPIMALQFLQVPAFRSFGLGLWSFQMVGGQLDGKRRLWFLPVSGFTCEVSHRSDIVIQMQYSTCALVLRIVQHDIMARHDASRRLGVELPWNEKDSHRSASMAVCRVLL